VSAPGPAPEVALFKLIEVTSLIKGIDLTLTRENQPLISFSLTGIRSYFLQRQYDMRLDVSVTSLSLIDQKATTDTMALLVTSGIPEAPVPSRLGQEQAMLKACIDLTDTLSPSFDARDRVMMSVDVYLSPVVVTAHARVIADVSLFFADALRYVIRLLSPTALLST